jgi:HCO3- transporter family
MNAYYPRHALFFHSATPGTYLACCHGGGMATYKLCSILPALAFSLDMFSQTDMSYGVNEVLLASVLGSVVFALAAAQPLVIVGVTGT